MAAKIEFSLIRTAVKNSQFAANITPKRGIQLPNSTRVRPEMTTKGRSAVIIIFANIVIGEKILK